MSPHSISTLYRFSLSAMKILSLSLAVCSLAALTIWTASCSLLDPADVSARTATESNAPASQASHTLSTLGTVRSIDMLDSKSWVIQGEDGKWYDPVNLPDSLKKVGAHISFSFQSAPDLSYTYKGGELIEIISVSHIK
jgi:hypothetical protein